MTHHEDSHQGRRRHLALTGVAVLVVLSATLSGTGAGLSAPRSGVTMVEAQGVTLLCASGPSAMGTPTSCRVLTRTPIR
jgi:hypothetical protein